MGEAGKILRKTQWQYNCKPIWPNRNLVLVWSQSWYYWNQNRYHKIKTLNSDLKISTKSQNQRLDTSGGTRTFAARGKHLCCRPHPYNQISNWYSCGYNDGISVDGEQYAKLALCWFYYVLVWTLQFVFIFLLGLVFMGRHKCEAVACLSSQMKCNFYELFIVHFNYGE